MSFQTPESDLHMCANWSADCAFIENSSCFSGKIHEKFNGKGYYFSWKDASTAKTEMDWLGIRNWCRQRCMDSVSTESSAENEYIKKKLVDG